MPQEKQTLELQDAKLKRRLAMEKGDPEAEKLAKLYAGKLRRDARRKLDQPSSVNIVLNDDDENALDKAWEDERKYQEKKDEKTDNKNSEESSAED